MKKSPIAHISSKQYNVRSKAASIVRKMREMNYSAENYAEALSLYFAYNAELPSSELSDLDLRGITENVIPVLSEIGEHVDINGKAILSEVKSIYRERYNLVFNPAVAIMHGLNPRRIDDRTSMLVAELLKLDD